MATIAINDLKAETTENEPPAVASIESVKGGKGKQEAYLTYKLSDVLISS